MTHHPGVAATLSLLLPGMGQSYNGTFWRAIFWFVLAPGLWIGSGGLHGSERSRHRPRRIGHRTPELRLSAGQAGEGDQG